MTAHLLAVVKYFHSRMSYSSTSLERGQGIFQSVFWATTVPLWIAGTPSRRVATAQLQTANSANGTVAPSRLKPILLYTETISLCKSSEHFVYNGSLDVAMSPLSDPRGMLVSAHGLVGQVVTAMLE